MHLLSASRTLSILAAAGTVTAHGSVTRFFVNGISQGDSVCLRVNPNWNNWSFPIEDLTSSDLACGFQGTKGVNRVCPVGDGATLTFQWQQYAQSDNGSVLPTNHMGPCAVYMKNVQSAINNTAAGDGWFKIWDAGYDESSQEWCTTKLMNNGGYLTVQLPQGLVGGYYLVRPELLALHEAETGNPQYYVACAQIFLQSNGSLVPSSTVSIPGYVSKNDAADSYNIWATPLSLPYPIPGPSVATFSSGNEVSQSTQTEGKLPSGCLVEVGSNWCGFEVASYSDQAGCYNSGQDCWNQGQQCWNLAPATGNSLCQTWNDKCQDIDNHCSAGDWSGPPNAGSTLSQWQTTSTIQPPSSLGPTMIGNSTVNASSAASAPSTQSSSPNDGAATTASPSSGSIEEPAQTGSSLLTAPASAVPESCVHVVTVTTTVTVDAPPASGFDTEGYRMSIFWKGM